MTTKQWVRTPSDITDRFPATNHNYEFVNFLMSFLTSTHPNESFILEALEVAESYPGAVNGTEDLVDRIRTVAYLMTWLWPIENSIQSFSLIGYYQDDFNSTGFTDNIAFSHGQNSEYSQHILLPELKIIEVKDGQVIVEVTPTEPHPRKMLILHQTALTYHYITGEVCLRRNGTDTYHEIIPKGAESGLRVGGLHGVEGSWATAHVRAIRPSISIRHAM